MKASDPDSPPGIDLDTFCLLLLPPGRGLCWKPITSGRRVTSRAMLSVLSRHSSALRGLRQSCDHCLGCCDQSCRLGGALSRHHHPTRLPRLHHRCQPRGGSGGRHLHYSCRHPRSHHPHRCGPRGCNCRCIAVSPECVPPTISLDRPEDVVLGLVVGDPQGLDEGKCRGGSRLSTIGGTIHVSPGRLH